MFILLTIFLCFGLRHFKLGRHGLLLKFFDNLIITHQAVNLLKKQPLRGVIWL